MMKFDIGTIHKLLWNSKEKVESYRCPSCGRTFDVEAVRKYTDNGEAAVCMDCGEEPVPVEGD